MLAGVFAALSLGCLPGIASAHSVVRIAGGELLYLSEDAVSLNTLSAGVSGDEIQLRDPSVEGGSDPGPCRPGEVTNDANAWIIEVFCPRSAVDRVRIDLGEREDSATVALPLPVTLLGGPGADRLTTGEGNDSVDGGDGGDTIDSGAGDDSVTSRDAVADQVSCGAGSDRVVADSLDVVSGDCETVDRVSVAAPVGVAGDRTGPRVEAGGSTLQRVGRLRVLATSSEPGWVAASGYLDVAGLALPLKSDRRRVGVGGGGVSLTIRLSASQLRQARRALARKRRVFVRVGVVGTDQAGNSTAVKAARIRLAGAGGASATTAAHPEPGDVDGDGVRDEFDNCPQNRNGDQADADADLLGDACDADADNDTYANADDNCPLVANNQEDDGPEGTPGNGVGDACDRDSDSDGWPDEAPPGRQKDNCTVIANPDQADYDFDRKGDVCDADDDEDGYFDVSDNCPYRYSIDLGDVDGDGIGNACDPTDDRPPAPPAAPAALDPGAKVQLRLNVGKRHRFAELEAGLAAGVRCSRDCTVAAELRVSAAEARRLRLGRSRTVGAGAARLDGAGSTYVFVRFGRATRRALWRSRGASVELRVSVSDRAGHRAGATRKLVLRR